MSHKWRRNKAWEDEHLTGSLAPVRVVLRVFETIPLAIVLLAFISLYATLASVPIGMLALIPTYAFYAITLLAPLAVLSIATVLLARRATRGSGRAARFLASFVPGVLVILAVGALWRSQVWPRLWYSQTTGEGVRFFADFCEAYASTTLRRLPGFEMTELQFYAWWPMKLALILFVINMIVTTVRRIEFNFKNLGVLSVHTGIVIIALGSLFYQRFKLEGDVLLPAAARGQPEGQPKRSFFSREEVVLFVAREMAFSGQPRFEQRLLRGMPRYNAYGLGVTIPDDAESLSSALGADPPVPGRSRPLRLEVPHPSDTTLDTDLTIEVVGYAPYATRREDWFRAPAPRDAEEADPLWVYEMYADVPGSSAPTDRPVFRYPLLPTIPTQRVRVNEAFGVEATRGMPRSRWDDLRAPVSQRADGAPVLHALILEVPGLGHREVVAVDEGQTIELGTTGWSVRVDELAPEPPFPIITPGYEDASSSVAILTIDAPGSETPPVSRWVFHRFPELNQDLAPSPGGRPVRAAPDPRIRVSYLDMTRLQVYIDEPTPGPRRAIVRQPATGAVRVFDPIPAQGLLDIVPNDDGARIDLRPSFSWEHARRVRYPVMVPEIEQDKSLVGSHQESFAAVRVSKGGWSETVWVPFAQYIGIDETHETIMLPDGSPLMIGFGRAQRPFPGFSVSLVDFEMIAYDHRGAPRDYQSLVRVAPAPSTLYPDPPDFKPYEHIVKLNAPLRAPYHWDPDASWLRNTAVRLLAGMNPDQFKLSQSGWDRAGWNQSQELVDRGVLQEPRVNFTILGVGNNPGIHVIALGSVMISLGIPWAFYLKPWLVRRERDRLAAAHAAPSTDKDASHPTPRSKDTVQQAELQESAT